MNTTPEPRGAPAERYPSVTAGVLVTNHDGSQSVDDRIRELEHQLATIRHALDNRDTIGMAKGVLMAREGIGPDEAFAMMFGVESFIGHGRRVPTTGLFGDDA